jgi:tRNA(Ile)-lysidine synthase
LQLQLVQLGTTADFDLVEQLRGSAGKFVSVGSSLFVSRVENGGLKLQSRSASEFNTNKLVVNLSGRAGEVIFGGAKFGWRIKDRIISTTRIGSRERSPHQVQKEFFDADKVGNEIILRHWRAGDRFQPIGSKSAAKLQDLFTNGKILRGRRRDLIVAATKRGEIFWVECLRIGENFKLTSQTKRCLIWSWRHAGAGKTQ